MLNIIQLIIVILLIITILLQQRGSGLGAAFGGEGAIYRTKRGAEKTIFILTIILALLFLGLSLVNVYLNTQDQTLSIPSDTAPNVLNPELPAEDELPLNNQLPDNQLPADEPPNNDSQSDIFKISEPKNQSTE